MLTQEQVTKNAKKYFKTTQELGVMNEELMTFLGAEFISAPATANKDQYNAFEGGLIDHLLNVTKYAVLINNALPEEERVPQNTLVRTCLLHQIGKAKLFTPCQSEWHIKNQGKLFEYKNDQTPMRVSERSVFYAMSNGIKLTDEEFAAIIMSDKTDDKMAEYHNTMLGEILKAAMTFAVKHAKRINNG